MEPTKKEDITYKGCILAVKSVMIAGLYLHRVRVWDRDGELLVAMRMWSGRPYSRKMFLKMQPDMPPGIARLLRMKQDAAELARATEGGPASEITSGAEEITT